MDILGNYSILISDILLQNTVFYQNELYIIDPGNFLITNIPLPSIDESNLFELQMGIKRIIEKLSKISGTDKRFFILNQCVALNPFLMDVLLFNI